MADDPRAEQFEESAQHPRDDADRLPTAGAPDSPRTASSPGEIAELDMGGGGPTGASGPGTSDQRNLDTGGASSLSGAIDDLPDMTGANAASSVSSPDDRSGDHPAGDPADNANMGRGSDRFDAARAYTGAEDDKPA